MCVSEWCVSVCVCVCVCAHVCDGNVSVSRAAGMHRWIMGVQCLAGNTERCPLLKDSRSFSSSQGSWVMRLSS